jgi:hypothetical protein
VSDLGHDPRVVVLDPAKSLLREGVDSLVTVDAPTWLSSGGFGASTAPGNAGSVVAPSPFPFLIRSHRHT